MTSRFPAPRRLRGSATTSSRTLVAILLAGLLLAPVATANHWYLHREGHDDSVARTLEPDDAVVHAAGNAFDGLANRITLAHETFGQGLFLDAFAGTSASATTPTLHPRFYSETILGRSDVLLPGNQHLAAWYGWWNDYDKDGVILDLHDNECGSALCPDDEFRWRGVGSDDPQVALASYIIPAQQATAIASQGHTLLPPYLVAEGNQASYTRRDLTDFTSHEHAEQAWKGVAFITTDGGFLTRLTTVVIAGATPSTTGVGFRLDDPAGLYDVDHYEAVDSDVEQLYLASVAFWRATDPFPVYDDLVLRPVREDVAPLATSTLLLALGVVRDVVANPTEYPYSQVKSRDPREPNHAADDYEDRARFGGVGDLEGSGNTYPGYEHGYGFFFDNVARMAACAGAHATTPVGVEAIQSHCLDTGRGSLSDYDAVGAQTGGERNANTALQFWGHAYMWQDRNKDGYMGAVCDPEDPEEFDAETRTCRNVPGPWPGFLGGESVGVCPATNLAGSTITLTPVGGSWPNIVVLRDLTRHPTSGVPSHEIRDDTEPIVLRYRDSCRGASVMTRDAVFFPGGVVSIGIRVEAEARLAYFEDSTAGISLTEEQRVLDVDYLPPSM